MSLRNIGRFLAVVAVITAMVFASKLMGAYTKVDIDVSDGTAEINLMDVRIGDMQMVSLIFESGLQEEYLVRKDRVGDFNSEQIGFYKRRLVEIQISDPFVGLIGTINVYRFDDNRRVSK